MISPDKSLVPLTPAQQRVLDRIAAQRARVHARWLAGKEAQAAAIDASNTADAPFLARLVAFARAHPVAVATALAGIAAVSGPRSLLRLGAVVLPLLLRLRR